MKDKKEYLRSQRIKAIEAKIPPRVIRDIPSNSSKEPERVLMFGDILEYIYRLTARNRDTGKYRGVEIVEVERLLTVFEYKNLPLNAQSNACLNFVCDIC